MIGVLNLLKPPHMSSGKAVAIVKSLTKLKVGHAGTLDPEAAGVLPIMLGRTTKLFDYISQDLKTYIVEIAFGIETNTQDAQGLVLFKDGRVPTICELQEVTKHFLGDIIQVPPIFSALKKDGKRLYHLAREGKVIDIPGRMVTVHSIEVLDKVHPDGFMLKISCGKGTYIRTLCHDIGRSLGMRAHMRFLLRERVGSFAVGDAITIEELAEKIKSGVPIQQLCIKPDEFLGYLPKRVVSDRSRKKLLNGVPICEDDLSFQESTPDGLYRLYLYDEMICISEAREGILRMKTMCRM